MAGYPSRYDWDAGYRTPFPPSTRGGGYDRAYRYDRPWTGGYHPGYQGGSEGIRVRTTPGSGGYGGRGGDWWMGGPDRGRETSRYDRAYSDFHRRNHPRFSPVAGNYHAMGGSYLQGRVPRPLREDQWFSDWTRWF